MKRLIAACLGLMPALVIASLVGAPDARAQQTIKIGVILPFSGQFADTGIQLDNGIKLYMQQHGDTVAGKKIEVIRKDVGGIAPEVAKRLAQELVVRDKVNLLTGVVWSPNAAAIAPVTAEAKLPFIIMNASGAAIVRLSPYVTRVSFTLWQSSYPLGKWAATHNFKRVYTAVSDFIPGHDGEAAFIKGLTENGGTIVDSVRFPLASPDLAPYFQRVKDAKPDALYVFVPGGPQSTNVVKTFKQLALGDAGIKLIGPQDITIENELPNMGDAALGVLTMGDYSSAADRPANLKFVEAWHKEYGDNSIPDFLSVDAWDGATAIFDLVKATKGKFTADEAMEFFKNWKNPDSPRGPIMIDPETRDIIQNIYIRRAEKVDGKLANVEIATIPQVKDPWKELNPAK